MNVHTGDDRRSPVSSAKKPRSSLSAGGAESDVSSVVFVNRPLPAKSAPKRNVKQPLQPNEKANGSLSVSAPGLLEQLAAHGAAFEQRKWIVLKAQQAVVEHIVASAVQLRELISLQCDDEAKMKEFWHRKDSFQELVTE